MAVDSTTIASGMVVGFAALCVASRFYIRKRDKTGIGWDDWWILIGFSMTFLTGGLLLWGVIADSTADKEIMDAIILKTTETFDIKPHTTFLNLSFACSILYFSDVTAIKISILLMYRRIFHIDTSFRRQSLLVGLVVVAFWLAATVAALANCHPFKYNWLSLQPEKYCFNYNLFWMITGAVEILIDTVILALPVRMVLGLQLSRQRKASIMFIFFLGGFVVVTGILRVIYGYIPGSRVLSYSKASLWTAVHIGMAIICACLPTLRHLFSRSALFASASSSIRRGYQSLRGTRSKGDSSSDSGVGLSITEKTGKSSIQQQRSGDPDLESQHELNEWPSMEITGEAR